MLCEQFPVHLAAGIVDRDPSSPELELLVSAFKAFAPASAAVVEWDYFDLDYRSEYASLQETVFALEGPQVVRVHFFDRTSTRRSTLVTKGKSLLEFVRAAAKFDDCYKGYTILRPRVPGLVGRSVISPHGRNGDLVRPSKLYSHVRTAVAEHIHLFGVPLRAVGVPFMEQDSHLQSCAQVSAWVCHYTAALRGIVPRRPTAAFSSGAFEAASDHGRLYPAAGLTSPMLCHILGSLDLPPEVITSRLLAKRRTPRWFDRKEIWQASKLPDESSEAREFWCTENLTASVCRYLNSGIPAILAREDKEHAQVVCGYLREEDLRGGAGANPLHSDVVAFIVSDDQQGPFELVSVSEVVKVLLYEGDEDDPDDWRDLSVIVPLPSSLWLAGRNAEFDGARVFEHCVRERLRRTRQWAQGLGLSAAEAEAHLTALKELRAGMDRASATTDGAYALRTYAINSNDFKAGFVERFDDPVAAEVVSLERLPKYVWVVEVLDRAQRAHSQPRPAVIGTVVLDGSAVSDSPEDVTGLSPLICHLPGQISALHPPFERNSHWRRTAIQPAYSGRWSHERGWLLSSHSTAARAKTATPARG